MKSCLFIGGGTLYILGASSTDKQTDFEINILSWIIQTLSPFSVVESKYFYEVIGSCGRSIVVPIRHKIIRRIIELEQHVLCQVQDIINSIDRKLSITTDAWSSSLYMGYISIHRHRIDSTWNIIKVVLGF